MGNKETSGSSQKQVSQKQVTHPSRHSEYYFDDGNLILLVENHLYNIHRGLLQRHSEVFCSMLSLPQPTGTAIEGSSDSNPIPLHGIISIDFERLLWVLYPPVVGELKPKTLAEWISVLDLSCRWAFEGVRNVAIRELEKLAVDPIDRLTISRKYDIKPEWVLPAYVALCERRDPLSVTEAIRIHSIETVTRLAQAREAVQRSIWSRDRDATLGQSGIWLPPTLTVDQIVHTMSPVERVKREHMNLVAKFFDLPKPS